MQVIKDLQEMQNLALQMESPAGTGLCLFISMTFFHQGHLSLMEYWPNPGRHLVVKYFCQSHPDLVPREDLERARDLLGDCDLAREVGVPPDLCPGDKTKYTLPDIRHSSLGHEECPRGSAGPLDPGHFRGVATVALETF